VCWKFKVSNPHWIQNNQNIFVSLWEICVLKLKKNKLLKIPQKYLKNTSKIPENTMQIHRFAVRTWPYVRTKRPKWRGRTAVRPYNPPGKNLVRPRYGRTTQKNLPIEYALGDTVIELTIIFWGKIDGRPSNFFGSCVSRHKDDCKIVKKIVKMFILTFLCTSEKHIVMHLRKNCVEKLLLRWE